MSRSDPRRVVDYLGHILQAIDNILEYTAGFTLEGYLADCKTQDAVVRNLEVMITPSSGRQCRTICGRFACR